MIRFIVVASLLAGCRLSLEKDAPDTADTVDSGVAGRVCSTGTGTQTCQDAASMNISDLAWIETNVFAGSCNFSGCHNGGGPSTVDLRAGKSYDHLVNFTSHIDSTRKIIVPSDIKASYLMMMVRDFAPADASPAATSLPAAGSMPQTSDNQPLCCQKLDAIERWIMKGAPKN